MPQEPIKKRICRAKARAIAYFKGAGYKILKSDNETFCFIAARKREVRFIRVVVDAITPNDRRIASLVDVPADACTREIYCWLDPDFVIEEVGYRNLSTINPPSS